MIVRIHYSAWELLVVFWYTKTIIGLTMDSTSEQEYILHSHHFMNSTF